MRLVSLSKQRLQKLRDEGWDTLLGEICSFCEKHNIPIFSMDENFLMKGRSLRKTNHVTNLHHYKVELFYPTIDSQLQELNNHFSETNIELLIYVACFNPNDLFASFDKEKFIRFAQFYPQDLSATDLVILDNQLETYILDMRSAKEFSSLNGIGSFAVKLVQTKRSIVYPLVYLLVKLALTLPVHYCKCRKSIFCDKNSEESAPKSDGRSVFERLSYFIY